MTTKLNTRNQNIAIGIIIFIVTYLGYFIISGDLSYARIWPASGFVIGFYLMFDNKVLPGIIVGSFLARIIARSIIFEEAIWFTFIFSIILVASNILAVYVFKKVMSESKALGNINTSSALVFFSSIILYSAINAIISVSFMELFIDINFLDTLIGWFISDIMGVSIFGTILLYSFYYDTEESNRKVSILHSALYLIAFTTITFAIFFPMDSTINFENFGFIFILLFLIPAFTFSYRMLLTSSSIYIFIIQAFYIGTLDVELQGLVALQYNFYLLILVIAASLTRMTINNLARKNIELEVTNLQLEDMIQSTYTLLKLGEKQQFQEEFNSEDYIKELFEVATKIFKNYDYASCYVKGEEFVHFVDTMGYDLEYLNNFKFRIEDFEWSKEIPEHVINSKKLVRDSLKDRYNQFIERTPELKETIRFSLFIEEGVVGGMSFDIIEGSNQRFTKSDYENMKSFQRIMNSFYETRFLLDRNSNLRDDIVLSLIRTLELYDQYTGGHSEEVAGLGLAIAQRMKLSEKDQYDVFWAGIVHDIGKVGIPSEILNKPERLSLEEYEKIKAHPGFGYEILKRSEDLANIAKLVKHHHEWWNGKGYPDGLKEKEIPLGAQIIQVVDSVSSMATKRPYTEIRSSQEILKELQLYKGSQFSPIVADEMISYINEGLLDEFYKNREDQ